MEIVGDLNKNFTENVGLKGNPETDKEKKHSDLLTAKTTGICLLRSSQKVFLVAYVTHCVKSALR